MLTLIRPAQFRPVETHSDISHPTINRPMAKIYADSQGVTFNEAKSA